MITQISNTNTHLVVQVGDDIRRIHKTLVREFSILKNTTLKIDIGGGALRNIFLLIEDIQAPTFTDNASLLSALNDMITPLEISITQNLQTLVQDIQTISNRVNNLIPATLQEPLFVDESNPNVVYKGYAESGSLSTEHKWAILRTTVREDITINEWAGGSQAMVHTWENRLEATYS